LARFLQTSDLHLNALRSRFDDYLERADQMLRALDYAAVSFRVDFTVVAGDFFDQPNLTNADRQLLSDWLARSPVPIIGISGNHDARTTSFGDTCLSHVTRLPMATHVLHDRAPVLVQHDAMDLILIPWHGWSDQEFHGIVTTLLDRRKRDVPVVVVAHEAFTGCRGDNGHEVHHHAQASIRTALPVTWWALGDMHQYQKLDSNAVYSGSPHQIDFGEGPDKGCCIVDFADGAATHRFTGLKSTPLVTLTEIPPDNVWPPFCRFKPEDFVANTLLPPGIEYVVPNISGTGQDNTVKSHQRDVLAGLADVLYRAKLPSELHGLSTEIAQSLLARA
jgi:DNA repair exonuclease SbcCD nuclease subunit